MPNSGSNPIRLSSPCPVSDPRFDELTGRHRSDENTRALQSLSLRSGDSQGSSVNSSDQIGLVSVTQIIEQHSSQPVS